MAQLLSQCSEDSYPKLLNPTSKKMPSKRWSHNNQLLDLLWSTNGLQVTVTVSVPLLNTDSKFLTSPHWQLLKKDTTTTNCILFFTSRFKIKKITKKGEGSFLIFSSQLWLFYGIGYLLRFDLFVVFLYIYSYVITWFAMYNRVHI